MKALDIVRLSIKNLRGGRAALPALGFAILAFCLCFSAAAWTDVAREKSLPCELAVSMPRGAIPDETLFLLAGIPGVEAVTPVLNVPATVKTGEYTAQLTLTGINASYLNEPYTKGGPFPDTGSMPRIVLNEAACRQFTSGREDGASGGGADKPLPAVDWLKASFTVQAGDTRAIVSGVCGVLAGEEGQEPAAYLSLAAARELLRLAGQSTDCTEAKVRVENIGRASGVSRAVAALGLAPQGADEESQKRWDAEAGEAGYLLAAGIFALLCACTLQYMWKKISLLERREAWGMLLWLGMRERDIGLLFALQAAFVSLIGAAAGIAVALALPGFLPRELAGASVFMLPIPIGIVVTCMLVCYLLFALYLAVSRSVSLSPPFRRHSSTAL
jgi:hypothetical protein